MMLALRCGLDEAFRELGYSFLEKMKRNEYPVMIGWLEEIQAVLGL
jgi:hypothetical protein